MIIFVTNPSGHIYNLNILQNIYKRGGMGILRWKTGKKYEKIQNFRIWQFLAELMCGPSTTYCESFTAKLAPQVLF